MRPAARRARRRAAAALGCGLLAVVAAVPPARAFTPDTTGGGTGALGTPFPDAAGTAAAPGTLTPPDYRYQNMLPLVEGGLPVPGFTVLPSIGLAEEFNDNIFQTEQNRRWDLITVLTPGIALAANTPRLDLSLQYNPSLEYYARTTSENTIAQQLSGVASLVVVPRSIYIDARAYASVEPVNGGFVGAGGQGAALGGYGYATGTGGFARQTTTQVFGESITPRITHTFGDLGTANLGLTLANTSTSGSYAGGSGSLSSADLLGSFASGAVLGRIQNTVTAEAYRATGTTFLTNASRETVQDQVGYALLRRLQVFVALGYEDITYGGTTALPVHDLTWQVGFSATPGPHSSLTFSYGHSYGTDGFNVAGSYALTSRTTATISYSRQITTYLQQVAAAVGAAGVNANGVLVNPVTGQPIIIGNPALAVENSVNLTTTLEATLTTLLDRDTVAFTLNHTDSTPLSAGGFSQADTVGTVSWTRALSTRANLAANVSYGFTQVPGLTGNSTLFSFASQFGYQLSARLSLTASYQFFRRNSSAAGYSIYDNVVFVGLTERF